MIGRLPSQRAINAEIDIFFYANPICFDAILENIRVSGDLRRHHGHTVT